MPTMKGEGERLMIGRIRVLHDGVDGHGFHYGEIWIGGSDIDGLGIDKSYGADEVWATVSVKTWSSYKEAKAALESQPQSRLLIEEGLDALTAKLEVRRARFDEMRVKKHGFMDWNTGQTDMADWVLERLKDLKASPTASGAGDKA